MPQKERHKSKMHTSESPTRHGLYIHIPFCKSRCIYCGFFSTTSHDMRQQYIDAICHEIELRRCEQLGTVYIGGGTPSLLNQEQLLQLFGTIKAVYPESLASSIEVTIECNPDDITDKFATFLSTLPVNRVSMGVQTFSNNRLRFLQRRHNAQQAHHAIELLKTNGIDNISIDLMFGFPQQTLEEWNQDIYEALSLRVPHISAYSLMFEEGTPLFHLLKQGVIHEIDDNDYIRMYDGLVTILRDAGYEHYEISNFALPGKRSIHNSNYWDDIPYIGIGASAHSYVNHHRQWNIPDLRQYIDSIRQNIIPAEFEEIDPTTHYNDMITTRLRTADGINLRRLREEQGTIYYDYLMKNATLSIETGLLKIEKGHLHLTLEGIHVSDMVMSELVMLKNDRS